MVGTVVFDFDGVIHSYTSGWQGFTAIPDPPVPGVKEAIDEIRAAGYEVVVVSTRCAYPEGHGAVRAWLIDHGIEVDAVKAEKPPAIVYIDDRAICFDGHPETLLEQIRTFTPWNKKETVEADKHQPLTHEQAKVILVLARNNLNAGKAAEELFFSAGTVRNRIREIRERTGKDPKNFYDLAMLVAEAKELLGG